MSESANCFVHPEGDPSDVLFQLPASSRSLYEGDTFTVTLEGGPKVKYKVESVDYRIDRQASDNTFNPHNFWMSPEIYYGVTVVV